MERLTATINRIYERIREEGRKEGKKDGRNIPCTK